MNKTKNIGLFVLLIIQAALIIYLYQPGRSQAPTAAALFSGLQADSVKALTITDDSGKSIQLAKTAGHWTVGGGIPADADKIKDIIKHIAELKNSRLVSRSKGSHSRLKVGEQMYNRKVGITGDSGTITFFLGTSPSSKTVHLRRADSDNVYEVSGLTAWQLQTDQQSWLQRKYVSVNPANIQGLIIKGRQSINLHRDAKGNWQLTDAPADSKLDDKRITELLDTISELSITSYQNKDFIPQGKPIATITYKTKDKTFDLQIWPKKDEKADKQVIKSSAAGLYANISSYILKDTIELKQADLVRKTEDKGQGTKDKKPQS